MITTLEAVRAYVGIGKAVIEAVAEAPEGLPSGHVYARVFMPKGVSLESYQRLIDILVDARCLTISNHVLRAVK